MVEEHIDKQSDNLNQLLVEVVKNQKKSYKSLVSTFIVTVVSLTVVICTLIICFTLYESQFETVDKTQTEITQEVSGENSSINNVTGNQYNDNAIHNEDK